MDLQGFKLNKIYFFDNKALNLVKKGFTAFQYFVGFYNQLINKKRIFSAVYNKKDKKINLIELVE